MAVRNEGAIMANELEWMGFASRMETGIREALDAAGVDCVMPRLSGPEHDAAFLPGQAADDRQDF